MEQYDTVRRRKDGTLVDVSLTLSPIKNNEGKIIGASAIAHEITNRKRAEELIRASEERLTNIIHNAAEIIYTMSLDGVFTFVSPVWTRILGHDVSEVEGQSFAPFIHPDDVAVCQAAIKRVSSHGGAAAWHVPYSSQRRKLAVAPHRWLLGQGQTRPPGLLRRGGGRRYRTLACRGDAAGQRGKIPHLHQQFTDRRVRDGFDRAICGGQCSRVVASSVTRKKN